MKRTLIVRIWKVIDVCQSPEVALLVQGTAGKDADGTSASDESNVEGQVLS